MLGELTIAGLERREKAPLHQIADISPRSLMRTSPWDVNFQLLPSSASFVVHADFQSEDDDVIIRG